MIQGYKSSIERLAKSFKQSRDLWKRRAIKAAKEAQGPRDSDSRLSER